jgi:hypothetical protein
VVIDYRSEKSDRVLPGRNESISLSCGPSPVYKSAIKRRGRHPSKIDAFLDGGLALSFLLVCALGQKQKRATKWTISSNRNTHTGSTLTSMLRFALKRRDFPNSLNGQRELVDG